MMPKDIGDASDDRYPGTVAIINAALVAVAVTSTAAWLALGLSHLGDRYKVGHVQGIWMALAQYAHEGTLYPPLSDGVRFGGTRYMPLPIVLNAAASRAKLETKLFAHPLGIFGVDGCNLSNYWMSGSARFNIWWALNAKNYTKPNP